MRVYSGANKWATGRNEGFYDEYGEMLENMKSWGKKSFQVRSMGGSDTEDFIYDFMEALGPHVESLKGSYRHDDEDGDRPEQFTYTKDGVI